MSEPLRIVSAGFVLNAQSLNDGDVRLVISEPDENGHAIQIRPSFAAHLRDWLTAHLARPDDADEPAPELVAWQSGGLTNEFAWRMGEHSSDEPEAFECDEDCDCTETCARLATPEPDDIVIAQVGEGFSHIGPPEPSLTQLRMWALDFAKLSTLSMADIIRDANLAAAYVLTGKAPE